MIDNQKRMPVFFPVAAFGRRLQINDFSHELFAEGLLESCRPLSYMVIFIVIEALTR